MGSRKLIGLALLAWPALAASQAFDNGGVVALHRAGLGDAAIVAKVKSSPCTFDLSTDALVALKKAGVSDPIMAAMIERCTGSTRAQRGDGNPPDPAAAHTPGIYVMQDWLAAPTMASVRPSRSSSIKVSGIGSVVFPYTGRLILPGAQSHLIVRSRRPTFYFYFPADDRNLADFGTANSIAAQSPEEFSLVRFKVKSDEREVGIGKLSAYSARRGIDGKDSIRFQGSEIGGTGYKVQVDGELAPGEYAFVLTGANNSARVYDFTVL